MKTNSWKNVPGQTFVEISIVDGLPSDDDGPVDLPVAQDGELVIEWESSGYYSPMSMYGGTDNLGHPAEGDDERMIHLSRSNVMIRFCLACLIAVSCLGCRAKPQIAIYVEKEWDTGDNLPAKSGINIFLQ